jgi:D-alanyl-D-alanine carboxypeptidase
LRGKPPLALTELATSGRSGAAPTPGGLLFNLGTGPVLWRRNPTLRLPIASLTKMTAALLTVQLAPPNAPMLVTRQAEEVPGSRWACYRSQGEYG